MRARIDGRRVARVFWDGILPDLQEELGVQPLRFQQFPGVLAGALNSAVGQVAIQWLRRPFWRVFIRGES